jgi:phosphate-selective porin OprO/OprP
MKRAQVQVGRFKVPFGLDELTPISRNPFAIRSLGATHLAPARDTGAMVHGRFPERRLNYWAGVFAHDGDHARSSNIAGGDQTFAARVTGRPFRSRGIDGLEVGTAFALTSLANDSPEPNGLRGRTVVAEDTFFHAVYVNGHRRRWEADIDWAAGRATARAEYTWASDDRHQQGIGNNDLPDARAQSWYVSGGWILVGEKARPRQGWRSMTPSTLGSIEIVGRLERLWFDSVGSGGGDSFRSPRAERISPSGERVLTLGVNWAITPHLRLQVNAIRERVEDVLRSPVPNGAPFSSRVARLQFVL